MTGMTGTATVTILFTDVVGSSELRTSRGDESAQKIMETHFELVRRDIERLGTKVKAINIALLPLLVGLAGVGYGFYRRGKK